jgi:coproporphyrinogen III oxidase
MDEATRARESLLALHERLTSTLLREDQDLLIKEDQWKREEGGGGKTWAVTGGNLIEKGGINFSDVRGDKLPQTATQNRPELAGSTFRAMGVSIVFHPDNPHVPTAHANVRYFEAVTPDNQKVWWFGGGFDMTPYYPRLEDAVYWHKAARGACAPFGEDLYPKFKDWCDQYFYLPHREETRGIGGIFFDDYNEGGFDQSLEFINSVGNTFNEAYFEIANKRRNTQFDQKQKAFQQYRRGRYVEFNLVYDRGTHFGLQSKGRTESILMSMPPTAQWAYDWSPEEGSEEQNLYLHFLKPRDWLNE